MIITPATRGFIGGSFLGRTLAAQPEIVSPLTLGQPGITALAHAGSFATTDQWYVYRLRRRHCAADKYSRRRIDHCSGR